MSIIIIITKYRLIFLPPSSAKKRKGFFLGFYGRLTGTDLAMQAKEQRA